MADSAKFDWSKKNVLVTGGTGSFGRKFCELMLKEFKPARLVVLSRDELKQHEMRISGFDHDTMRWFIGDIRDKERLLRAFDGVDVVFHAAALKQVPTCEYNPFEAILTNVIGARNVIEAAVDSGVERVVALSTDKAVNPVNLYGATKLCLEKLFVRGNAYSREGRARFSVVRYGNVMGSRGSVLPIFLEQRSRGALTVTDPRMTRFWLTLEAGVRFAIRAAERMTAGEVFVPKIASMKVTDLAKVVAPEAKIDYVGIRPGEKLHETLVSEDEGRHAVELKDMYVIRPENPTWPVGAWKDGKPLAEGFSFSSDNNTWWLSNEEMSALVENQNGSQTLRAVG